MAVAMLNFVQTHPTLKSVVRKYSVPGHSCIQEVDNLHSQLETVFRKAEFYSPLSLNRLIDAANKKRPFKVIEIRTRDVKVYQKCAQTLIFKKGALLQSCSCKVC